MTTYRLTLAQRTLIEKARNVGNSEMAVPLSSEVCAYLCGVVVKDLGLVSGVPEVRVLPVELRRPPHRARPLCQPPKWGTPTTG
jgi:hypothetical protein